MEKYTKIKFILEGGYSETAEVTYPTSDQNKFIVRFKSGQGAVIDLKKENIDWVRI